MSQTPPSPQINVSKIPGGAGIAGALFAIISMVIFLIRHSAGALHVSGGYRDRVWSRAGDALDAARDSGRALDSIREKIGSTSRRY